MSEDSVSLTEALRKFEEANAPTSPWYLPEWVRVLAAAAQEHHDRCLQPPTDEEVEDELALVIGDAVTLDDDSVRENPMQLHDAAKAVMALLARRVEGTE